MEWTKVTAVVGLVAGAVTAIIATAEFQLSVLGIPAETFEPIVIGLITGLVGIFFPKGTEPVSGGLPGEAQ